MILGALVHIKGIDHPLTTTQNGEYWKLLAPGKYLARAILKNPSTGKELKKTPFKTVKIPASKKFWRQKNAAIRIDFEL